MSLPPPSRLLARVSASCWRRGTPTSGPMFTRSVYGTPDMAVYWTRQALSPMRTGTTPRWLTDSTNRLTLKPSPQMRLHEQYPAVEAIWILQKQFSHWHSRSTRPPRFRSGRHFQKCRVTLEAARNIQRTAQAGYRYLVPRKSMPSKHDGECTALGCEQPGS
jgi:hypothetical protein